MPPPPTDHPRLLAGRGTPPPAPPRAGPSGRPAAAALILFLLEGRGQLIELGVEAAALVFVQRLAAEADAVEQVGHPARQAGQRRGGGVGPQRLAGAGAELARGLGR